MAKKEFKEVIAKQEMTIEESKAYRASLYRPKKKLLSESERRNSFRLFWAQNRKQYGEDKTLEPILWIHLMATGNDQPDKFENGLAHFGLKRIR
jgi:hypothetical protein